MNPYIEKLNAYLAETPLADGKSILDQLCYYYTVLCCLENDTIRDGFREIDRVLKVLPFEEQDRVSDLTSDICIECTRIAFLEGVQVGYRLSTELANPE